MSILEEEKKKNNGSIRMIQNDVLGNARMEGHAEGKAEGRAEGRAEEKSELARKMMKCGMDMEQISQITGLSLEQIKKL